MDFGGVATGEVIRVPKRELGESVETLDVQKLGMSNERKKKSPPHVVVGGGDIMMSAAIASAGNYSELAWQRLKRILGKIRSSIVKPFYIFEAPAFLLQHTMGIELLPLVYLALAAAGLLCISWKAVHVLWLTPKRLEKCLRDQGFTGNAYRFLVGDLMELSKLMKERLSIPIKLDDDHGPHTLPMEYRTLKRYGKNSFFWFGVTPRITIVEPDLIREILNKHETFHKIKLDTKLLVTGLVTYEGEKWTRHRRILTPVFHIEKLRYTLLSMQMSCDSMVRKWEEILSNEEHVDLDIWPFIDHMAGETISRAAFGSSYEQGVQIFGLQKVQIEHTFDQHRSKLNQVPGLRSVPTKRSRKMKEIHKTVRALILDLIERRKSETGEVEKKEGDEDLLGILLESNRKEVGEGSTGSGSSNGMPMEDVVEEVKLFYLAGQDTTASTLVWAMVLLSQHQDWQQSARDEVLQLFGTVTPHFDGLARLKTVTMIINEVLRLYPPVTRLVRSVDLARNDTLLADNLCA
ncbi:hypothetical protein Droror1_Dr00014974 [Drosera rotundifolia]